MYNKGKDILKKQKSLLALERESNKIRDAIGKLPSIPLPKPVFYAYTVTWVLRDFNSKYYDTYSIIIDNFSKSTYVKSIKKARELNPEAIVLRPDEYKKLVYQFPDAIRWFIKRKNKYNETEYRFSKTEILKKKIYKVFHTHTKQIDPNLISRMKEIEQTIYDNVDNLKLLNKIHGIGKHRDYDWNEPKIRADKRWGMLLLKEME